MNVLRRFSDFRVTVGCVANARLVSVCLPVNMLTVTEHSTHTHTHSLSGVVLYDTTPRPVVDVPGRWVGFWQFPGVRGKRVFVPASSSKIVAPRTSGNWWLLAAWYEPGTGIIFFHLARSGKRTRGWGTDQTPPPYTGEWGWVVESL